MKPSIYRRIRRRSSSHEAVTSNKESKQEQSFFGEATHETFFQPAPVVQRKCEGCEEDDKKVQRQPEKKEEEKVMKAEDKKEEEKIVQKKEDKKEEEKVMKKEEKEEEKPIQKKEISSNASAGNNAGNYIGSLNGKGNPLPANANHFFSSKMGYDFSNVKVHTDKEAAESAKDVNAKAYTIGNNIVFNEGQYNNETGEGKKLMAHELAHVMQQENQMISRKKEVKAPEPECISADPILNDIKVFLNMLCNEIDKPDSDGKKAKRIELKTKLVLMNMQNLIDSLPGFVAEGCCEPALANLLSKAASLDCGDLLKNIQIPDVMTKKAEILITIRKTMEVAKKDLTHC